MIKALIFDLDGTIADTEATHFTAYRDTLANYGIKITQKDFIQKWLKGDASAIRKVLKRGGDNPQETKQKARAEKEKLYLQMVSAHGVKALPGAEKLILQAKKNGLKLILASGSTQNEIKKVLQKLKLYRFFDIVLGLNDVERNKPDPEMFLLAAKKLKLKPAEILVIENAPNGLNSAKAAGMKCLIIPSNWTKILDFPGADLILNSLEEVTLDLISKFN